MAAHSRPDRAREGPARALGLDGWVRNQRDGSVEAVFEGSPEAVEALVTWCRRGPRSARVDALDVTEEPEEDLHGFEIRY